MNQRPGSSLGVTQQSGGPPAFKIVERVKPRWRVRFPSASARASTGGLAS